MRGPVAAAVMISRREAIRRLSLAGSALLTGGRPREVWGSDERHPLLKRLIPSSGERLPVIGLGTARTFNVAPGNLEHAAAVRAVLREFHGAGAEVVDVAPHGTVEETLGRALRDLGITDQIFLAAKVIVRESVPESREIGIVQLEASHELLGRRQFDLLQVGNLFDVGSQLPTVLRWRAEGRARYGGITVSSRSQYEEAERLLRSHSLEFIQLNYSIDVRDAEERLLPFAADHGMAVLVNVPFGNGRLFQRVAGKMLPEWAEELGITSWAQYFLKFIIGHPAVTAVLPATRNPLHMLDNLSAAVGPAPTAEDRKRMLAFFESL